MVHTTRDDVGDGEHELTALTAESSEPLVTHHPHVHIGDTAGQLLELREPLHSGGLLETNLCCGHVQYAQQQQLKQFSYPNYHIEDMHT